MSDFLISICIPTYNRPDLLKDCLQSFVEHLSSENMRQIEFVITDNSDNNQTELILLSFKSQLINVNYYKNSENIGGSANIFQALDLATGKYLWLMGDDDMVTSKINTLFNKLTNVDYSAVILNFAQGDTVNPNIRLMNNCLGIDDDKIFYGKNDLFAGDDFRNFFAINFMSALVFNRNQYEEVRDLAKSYAKTCYPQSYLFLLIALCEHFPILRLRDVYVTWRSAYNNRRYNELQASDDHIFRQYVEYIQFAKDLGFIFSDVYLQETISKKACNLFYIKKNTWKQVIKKLLFVLHLNHPAYWLINRYRKLQSLIIYK